MLQSLHLSKKRQPLQSRAENCFWKLLFPAVGFWREYRERSQANDNLLRFSGHLGFPRAKSAFKDHFLHHPVQIMSILSNWVWWGVNEEDPLINVSAEPFLDWLFQCAVIENRSEPWTRRYVTRRITSVWPAQQVKNQLGCEKRP